MYTVTLGKKLGNATAIPVDFDAFPDHVKRHIIGYGVQQFFIDKANTTKTAEGKADVVKAAIAACMNGETGKRRAAAAPADEKTLCARIVVGRLFKAKFGPKTPEGKAFKDLDSAKRAVFLDDLAAKNAAKIEKDVVALMKLRAAERAATPSIDLDL